MKTRRGGSSDPSGAAEGRNGEPTWAHLSASIAGDVILPDSVGPDRLPRPFNLRFRDVVPRAVVRCSGPDDVVETIAFVRRHGLQLAIRNGGHCFSGRSSTRGVLIDLSRMGFGSLAGDAATVGGGALSGDVYEALQKHGRAIPAGTCPSVGAAGVTLGGGLGILGRRYGVTSDSLVAARVVLADGRTLDVDEHRHEDLFWALRGAGAGNFGVVTSLVFRTVPAPTVANAHLAWPFTEAASLIEAWQHWAPAGPDELAASMKLTLSSEAELGPSVDLFAALQSSASDLTELLAELVDRAGSEPSSSFIRTMSFPETRMLWANLGVDNLASNDVGEAEVPHVYLIAKSEFFSRPLPTEAIEALVATFEGGWTSGEERELDFMPWGGAYNRVPPHATAFVHRSERFQLKHAAVVDPAAASASVESARAWVQRSWMTVHPWGSGRVFQNFIDLDLEDWPTAYYGDNYERLLRIKARYDPDDVFRSSQSIPVRSTAG
jgi:FAD/FMN-containing dehydrogenase